MTPSNVQVRRATVDDLVELRQLWSQAQFDIAGIEKRLTEFQVAETVDGRILAGIGIQVDGKQGLIHHEVFREPEAAASLRPRLWERVQTIARNHGLVRLWIVDTGEAYWPEAGFAKPDAAALRKLPPAFGSGEARWLILKLRDESLDAISIEREFDLFKQSQVELSQRALGQARMLKAIAWMILLAAMAGVVALGIYVAKRIPRKNRLQP